MGDQLIAGGVQCMMGYTVRDDKTEYTFIIAIMGRDPEDDVEI